VSSETPYPEIDMDGIRRVGEELRNWGRWGPTDQRGTLNFITPECTRAAAATVRRGLSFSLSVPLDDTGPWTDPGRSGRFNPIHRMTRYRGDNHLGRSWDGFSSCEDMLIIGTHSSTHFDALSHLWYDDLVYNGVHHDKAVTAWGAHHCSIESMRGGIITRGILLDVARHMAVDCLPPGSAIGPAVLDAVISAAGVEPRAGDVALIRTGTYPQMRRGAQVARGGFPGLTWECARWMHAHDIAAVCADNLAVEATGGNGEGPPAPFHMIGLRDMGLVFGELFDFEDLAVDCAADGVYECLFVGAPLDIPGGVGSPINPLAIK
jgi:kynurenine formamidase